MLKNIGIANALDLKDLVNAETTFNKALALAQNSKNRREEMQTRLYLAETLFRGSPIVRAHIEFSRANVLALQLGTVDEQWKSLYGLGRIERLSGNTDHAEAYFRQAIGLIEKTRSQVPLSALRSEFFADKREAYDALLAILMERGDASQAFEILERSRARSFQDRVLGSNSRHSSRLLGLSDTEALLDEHTLLLEYWAAPQKVGLIWCTQHASGLINLRISAEQDDKIQALLDGLPGSLELLWKSQSTNLDSLFPDPSSLPDGIKLVIVVPDLWISYVPFDLIHSSRVSDSMLIELYDIVWMPSAVL